MVIPCLCSFTVPSSPSAELVGARPLHLLTQTVLLLKHPTGALIAFASLRPALFESCAVHHKKIPRPFGLGIRGGAFFTALEPLSRHIIASVSALQTEEWRDFRTFQSLFVRFFELILMQSDTVQQITLILRSSIIVHTKSLTDSTELVKHFNSSRRHSFYFNIHNKTTFQERYVLKSERAALSAIISIIGPPDCLANTRIAPKSRI